MPPSRRVPGLPRRDYAGGHNNCIPRRSKMIAIDVTAKILFERLYLVSGLRQFMPFSPWPRRPHPHRSLHDYFLISVKYFSPVACQFFFVSTIHQVIWQHNLPSNLAESWYPPFKLISWSQNVRLTYIVSVYDVCPIRITKVSLVLVDLIPNDTYTRDPRKLILILPSSLNQQSFVRVFSSLSLWVLQVFSTVVMQSTKSPFRVVSTTAWTLSG